MTATVELISFVGLVVILAVIGIWLGMLLAPRLDRLTAHEEMTTPDDEDDGGRPD